MRRGAMHFHRLVVCMVAAAGLTLATAWAGGPKEKEIHGSFAGAFSPSDFDFNGDGITASIGLYTGKGNGGGEFTSYAKSELGPPLGTNVTCPSDTLEFPYRESTSVATFSSTDQLFSGEQDDGTFCVNPLTGKFTFEVTEFYFGGTGKYEGASGSFHSSGTGNLLNCDAAGRCFGSSAGTYTGTLILP
jgi:hypothetical protein